MRLFIILSVICVSLFVLVICIFLKSILTMRVKLLISAHSCSWKVKIYIWGICLWAQQSDPLRQVPSESTANQKHDPGHSQQELADWQEQLGQGIRLLRKMNVSHKIRVQLVSWVTQCGTGDAFETAILSGIIWSIKASLMPWIAPWISDRPRIQVVPVFQRMSLCSDLSCMFQLRIGDAIVMIKKIRRLMKEG